MLALANSKYIPVIDENSQILTVKDFGGAATLPDAAEVPLGKALIARNVEYTAGEVGTRLGFGLASASLPTEGSTSMFNWISSLGNKLVWFRSSDRKLRISDIDSPAGATLINTDLVGYATSHASAGARLYTACFDASGRGAVGAYVSSYQSAAFVSDLALQGPIGYTPAAPTEPAGVGLCTAGIHRIGYRLEYRSGFITRPSPDSSTSTRPDVTTFAPISFTSAGAKKIRIVLNTTWPTAAVKVHIVMTPVTNLNQYIMVPGANATVTGGILESHTFDINISDEDLLNNPAVNEVSDALNYLTNSVDASLPAFKPSKVFTHGDRMVYIITILDNVGNAQSAVAISKRGDYQALAADRNLIQLPGNLDINCGCSLDNTLFLMGPGWTYRTSDNGGDPTTWPTPALVDGAHGTQSPRGVEVSPSGTYAWNADVQGLYFFNGAFPDLPVSYIQGGAEWARINWAAAKCIIVKDYTDKKKVCVLAPLDSATSPSHLLTWDYTNGKDYKTVRFSFDTVASVSMGAIEVAQNTLPGMPASVSHAKELWVASSGSDGIFRSLSVDDANPYRDNGQGIDCQYRTSFFRPPDKNHTQEHQGAHFRLRGSPSVDITAHNFDYLTSVGPVPTPISTAPGPDWLFPYSLLGEGVAYDFACNVVDGYFKLSYARHYSVPWGML